jgi:hypothetical protein
LKAEIYVSLNWPPLALSKIQTLKENSPAAKALTESEVAPQVDLQSGEKGVSIMAPKLKDFMEDGPGGWVAGIGALVLAPIVVPALAKAGKPLAKAAIKGGLRLYEESKGAILEAGEILEDLVAEAQAEMADERAQAEADYSTTINTKAEPSE